MQRACSPTGKTPRERAISIALVAAIHVGLAYALLFGLGVDLPRQVADSLATFTVLPPPAPEPPQPKPRAASHRAPRKEGAASPANLAAKATPVVAPTPVVVLPPPPPPVVTSVKAGEGAADHAGAAPVPGPGTGSGGIGTGTGSGNSGDGPGGGGSGGEMYELVGGRIRDSDYPRGMPEDGRSYTVRVKFIVGVDGRLSRCTVMKPSGSPVLDGAICGLMINRLRFRPSRDAQGRPFPDYGFWEQTWRGDVYEPRDD